MESSVTLGEVATLYDSLHKTPENYTDTGYPMIRVTDVKRGFLNFEGTKKVGLDVYEEFSKKYKPQIGDVIFTRVGSYGNSCYVDKKAHFCLGQNTVCINPDIDKVYPHYLYTFLNSPEAKNQIDSFISGSSQPTISLKSIKEIKLSLPSLDSQIKISKVVSAYDNLIENNNRRISILEEMAQSLYREWFVNFRFPGHQNCQFKDSPSGQIPEGWEVKSAAEVIDINPRTSLPKEGVKPFVPMTSLSESSMIISEIEERAGNSGTKFKNRDTLFARITPCLQNGKIGYVQFLNEENPIGFGSTEFIVLRESILPSEYIYCLARSSNFRSHAINSMAGADGRQRVKPDCFSAYFLALPSAEILEVFSAAAKPCFHEIHILNKKNKNLKEQRNMLLPKLISGQIQLEH